MAETNLSSRYCIKHFVHLSFDSRVCLLANEWKVVETFFFPYWTMLGQVFLILMCIIFEHGSAASIVTTRSCASRWDSCFSFFILEDLAALIGRLETLSVGRGAGEVWQSVCEWLEVDDVNEACRFIAKPSQLTLVTCISLLLLPPCAICFVHLRLDCITVIAKCLNIVQFHLSFLSFTYHIL